MNAGAQARGASRPLAAFERLTAALDRGTCFACVALFAAILVVMICQVTWRYVLNAPLTWTEELARYLFIWACYLGAPVATRRGNHVTILFVVERLPKGISQFVGLGIQAISLVFFIELGLLGAALAARSHSVEAITLPIPWSLIYAVVPVSAVLMILHTVEGGWKLLQGARQEVGA